MSGPFCETCKYFQEAVRGSRPDGTHGECTDPTKIIYYERVGAPRNERPSVVAEFHSCRNHTPVNTDE